ncbi:hypothetical protein [Chromatocurvus halotolerans]|uniref:Uncharacterized protein n=1 Tax=Chromatocurvus halotolerans TaxID=1132028 RepID=A0A4R2L3P4_9GAMM|nr:hypothetical protein EV688_101386 [Chromatocurvus halotolerans]
MAMTLVKKTADYCIYKRGDDRFAVENAHRKPVNGDEKVAILLQEGLIEAPKVKAPEPEPEAEETEAAAEGDAAEDAPAADDNA